MLSHLFSFVKIFPQVICWRKFWPTPNQKLMEPLAHLPERPSCTLLTNWTPPQCFFPWMPTKSPKFLPMAPMLYLRSTRFWVFGESRWLSAKPPLVPVLIDFSQLFYQNYQSYDPVPVKINGCGYFCPYEEFYSLVEEILPESDDECFS